MTITTEEVEILMLANAARSAELSVARMRRRVKAAEIELSDAVSQLLRTEEALRVKREAYLMRTV